MMSAKKLVSVILGVIIALELFGSLHVEANEVMAIPKFKVKMVSNSTGVKISIGRTSDADGYEIYVSGTPDNSDYCKYFKYKDNKGNVYIGTEYTEYLNKNGKAKRSITLRSLQPGTYTLKIRSYNNEKYGTKTYSKWSEEKKVKVEEAKTKGYSTLYDFSNVNKGDVVKFGAYEQDLNYTNGKEPIEWIVINKTKNSILLLSKYALDKLPYNIDFVDVTWETCTLRKWLNNNFIKSAFNKAERGLIKKTTNQNMDNVREGTIGGNKTKDKVFLLSEYDMINSDYGFLNYSSEYDINRNCAFAWYKNKLGSGHKATEEGEYTCWWWLRSPGYTSRYATDVSIYGYVYLNGEQVASTGGGLYDYAAGVRPAIYIKITS